MFEEMIKRAEKAANDMGEKVGIRMDGLETKIDSIGSDIAEIKSMLQKLQ